MRIVFIYIGLIFFISACGQSGHLYLPTNTATTAPASTANFQHGITNQG